MSQVASKKSKIAAQLPVACSNERAAVEFLEAMRWQGHPSCPHCGVVDDCRQMQAREGGRNKRFLWRCYSCKRQFTVRVGTVFEDSRIPLRHWCYAFWVACASKKGVSALQIKRQTQLSYKSALFMMHRIRYAMSTEPVTPTPLTGIVEVDETYVGGKPRYVQSGQPPYHRRKYDMSKKTPVLAIVQRGGDVRPFQLTRPAGEVQRLVRIHVDPSSRLMTDEHPIYKKLGKEFAEHTTTMHSVKEYVRGEVHSNTVESFFSLLKRGIYGTFHSVSVKHLHRYLSEFEYRYNTRNINDGERTAIAIQKAAGKRLTYREQVG